MSDKQFYVYILTNKPYGVFYVGVTSDLPKRIWQHKSKAIPGFSQKYNLTHLMYYEVIDNAEAAIKREKTLKRWPREWKINIIQQMNPDWHDLYEQILA